MLDSIITNARIVDGTGSPWFHGHVGLMGGRIAVIGRGQPPAAHLVHDARGQMLCPGFVDVHTHDDLAFVRDPAFPPKLLQGVTSAVLGNCGFGAAPVAPANEKKLRDYIQPVLGALSTNLPWSSFPEYMVRLSARPASINLVTQVAHGTVRIAVMGFEARPATKTEIDAMCTLVRDGMQAGAIGLSLGLLYAPGCYADRQELVALAAASAREGGMLNCHVRGEGDHLLDSLQEVMAIAEAAESPLHISHLKVIGMKNWGTIQRALDLIERRRRHGLDVTCDVYTYTAGSSTLLSILPAWVSAGGADEAVKRLSNETQRERIRREMEADDPNWDNFVKLLGWDKIVISSVGSNANRAIEGMSLASIAKQRNEEPLDCMLDLLLEENGRITMIVHQMSEEDVKTVLLSDYAMVGSDGLPIDAGMIHPRLHGTFPRMLAHYVRRYGIMSVEHAVRKMTSISARRFGMQGRGLIAEGMCADLIVFDENIIEDKATFEAPRRSPEGISRVFVSGEIAVCEGKPTGVLRGALQHRSGCACAAHRSPHTRKDTAEKHGISTACP